MYVAMLILKVDMCKAEKIDDHANGMKFISILRIFQVETIGNSHY